MNFPTDRAPPAAPGHSHDVEFNILTSLVPELQGEVQRQASLCTRICLSLSSKAYYRSRPRITLKTFARSICEEGLTNLIPFAFELGAGALIEDHLPDLIRAGRIQFDFFNVFWVELLEYNKVRDQLLGYSHLPHGHEFYLAAAEVDNAEILALIDVPPPPSDPSWEGGFDNFLFSAEPAEKAEKAESKPKSRYHDLLISGYIRGSNMQKLLDKRDYIRNSLLFRSDLSHANLDLLRWLDSPVDLLTLKTATSSPHVEGFKLLYQSNVHRRENLDQYLLTETMREGRLDNFLFIYSRLPQPVSKATLMRAMRQKNEKEQRLKNWSVIEWILSHGVSWSDFPSPVEAAQAIWGVHPANPKPLAHIFPHLLRLGFPFSVDDVEIFLPDADIHVLKHFISLGWRPTDPEVLTQVGGGFKAPYLEQSLTFLISQGAPMTARFFSEVVRSGMRTSFLKWLISVGCPTEPTVFYWKVHFSLAFKLVTTPTSPPLPLPHPDPRLSYFFSESQHHFSTSN